jgi:hypothetical protein
MLANRMMMAAAGADSEVAWINLSATEFSLGNTANVSWASNSVTMNAGDINIRTALTFIPVSTDFDFYYTMSAVGTDNGPAGGFYDNGTNNGVLVPTLTDDIVFARNSGGAGPGWMHGNDNPDGSAKSAGWMASKTIQISRRGTTYYGLLDGVLDKTFAEVTGDTVGGLFLGSGGGISGGFTFGDVKYRLGPGLAVIV